MTLEVGDARFKLVPHEGGYLVSGSVCLCVVQWLCTPDGIFNGPPEYNPYKDTWHVRIDWSQWTWLCGNDPDESEAMGAYVTKQGRRELEDGLILTIANCPGH